MENRTTIRQLREQRGIPLYKMSDSTNIDFDMLSRIENNKKVGSLGHYTSIAKSLEISVGELLASVEISPDTFE